MRNSKLQAKYLTELSKNTELTMLNTTTLDEINQTSTNSKGFERLLKLNINQLNLFEKWNQRN
jgi:hypothetical protein